MNPANEQLLNEDLLCSIAGQDLTALEYLCAAIRKAVADLNARLNAGLEVQQSQTRLEVHAIDQPAVLMSVDLTDKNDIEYSQFIKRDDEMQAGTMHVCAGASADNKIMFPDLPRSPRALSYDEVSRQLLSPTF